jgi:hypothetical protein
MCRQNRTQEADSEDCKHPSWFCRNAADPGETVNSYNEAPQGNTDASEAARAPRGRRRAPVAAGASRVLGESNGTVLDGLPPKVPTKTAVRTRRAEVSSVTEDEEHELALCGQANGPVVYPLNSSNISLCFARQSSLHRMVGTSSPMRRPSPCQQRLTCRQLRTMQCGQPLSGPLRQVSSVVLLNWATKTLQPDMAAWACRARGRPGGRQGPC